MNEENDCLRFRGNDRASVDVQSLLVLKVIGRVAWLSNCGSMVRLISIIYEHENKQANKKKIINTRSKQPSQGPCRSKGTSQSTVFPPRRHPRKYLPQSATHKVGRPKITWHEQNVQNFTSSGHFGASPKEDDRSLALPVSTQSNLCPTKFHSRVN